MFGIGLAASGAIFGGWNWRRGNSYVNVNVDRAVHIDRTYNAATVNNGAWQHNADHRKGIAYRDPAVGQQFGQSRPGIDQRQQYRGRTANAPANQPAQATARPAVPQQPTARPAVPQQTAPVPQHATPEPATGRQTPAQPSATQRPGAQPLPQAQTRAPATPPVQRGAALGGIDRGQQINREAARGRVQQTRAAAPAAAARPAAPARPPAAAAARPAAGVANPATGTGGRR